MAAPGEPLEGALPVPHYPNPMANNVNMHPMGLSQGEGAVWRGEDPIGPGLGNGTQVTHS